MTSFALLDMDPRYMVDSDGNVYGPKAGKMKQMAPGDGYLYVNVGDRHRRQLVHRLVATAFIPNPEGKPQVAHWDGDKANNHVTNLRWATNEENHSDRWRHNGWGWKLTKDDVRDIRKLLDEGDLYQYEIAERFGVTPPAISQIFLGKSWTKESD